MVSTFGVKKRKPFTIPLAISAAMAAATMIGISKEDGENFFQGISSSFNTGWNQKIAAPDLQMTVEPQPSAQDSGILMVKVDERNNCSALFDLATGSTDLRDGRYFDLAQSFDENAVCVEFLPAQENFPPFNVLDTLSWKPASHTLS